MGNIECGYIILDIDISIPAPQIHNNTLPICSLEYRYQVTILKKAVGNVRNVSKISGTLESRAYDGRRGRTKVLVVWGFCALHIGILIVSAHSSESYIAQ